VLINDLNVKQTEADAADVKVQLEAFHERLDRELRFVGRACELTPEQKASLDERTRAIRDKLTAIVGRFAVKGGRIAIPNARIAAVEGQVVVIDAQGQVRAAISDGQIRRQLDAAVQAALAPECVATLTIQRDWIEGQKKRAHVLSLLAAIDEAMLLAPLQRDRFRDYLEPNWRPAWEQIVSGSQWPAAATPLQTAKSRGLGGIFDLFDADLEPLLTAPQLAAWREMRTLSINAAGVGLAGGGLRPGAAILRGRVNGRIVVAQGAIAPAPRAAPVRIVPAPPVEPRQSVLARGQKLAEPAGVPAIEPPPELALYLALLIADVATEAQLSEEQAETLLLAGQLDIKRYQDERAKAAEELLQQARAAGANVRIVARAEPLAASNPFAQAASRYQKALGAKLSEDQLRRLAAAGRARRERLREAAVETFVDEFNERLLLTSRQWNALAEALGRRLPPISEESLKTPVREELLNCFASLGAEELRALVDDDQWPAAELKLEQLKRIADGLPRP
jgi:hypothetical protein